MDSLCLKTSSPDLVRKFIWALVALGIFSALAVAIGSDRADLVLLLFCLPAVLLLTMLFIDQPHWPILLVAASYMIDIHFSFKGITSNIILFVACFLSLMIKKQKFYIVPERAFLLFLLTYVTLIAFSYFKTHGSISYYNINLYFNNIVLLLLMFLFNSKRKIDSFYQMILWSSVVLVALGLYQIVFSGMPRGGATAHYANHVVYALHIGWGVPLSLYFWSETKKKWYLLVLAFQSLGLLLAYSRGVILAVAVSMVLYSLIIKYKDCGRPAKILMLGLLHLGVVATFALLFIVAPQVERFARENAFEISSGRNVLYGAAWQIMKEHPVAGVGWDNYRETWSGYVHLVRPKYGAYVGDQRLNPHSSYLKVITELGVVGFLVFMAFNLIVIRLAFKAVRYPEARPILMMLLIYYIHGLYDNNSYGNDRMFYMMSGILFSIVFYMKNLHGNEWSSKRWKQH